jgi:cohesin loading factor subunit SCC2
MLEKVMREADEIDVFVELKKVDAVAAGKKIKGVKGKKGSKSPDLLDEAEVKEEVELSDDSVRRLEGELQKVATAGVAAAAVLALLDLEGLSKQVSCLVSFVLFTDTDPQMYSEDLLSSAVSVTKDQMTKVVFPVVSGLNGESECHLYASNASLTPRNAIGIPQSCSGW